MTSYDKALRLDGKTALVSGAARGLGAETARALAAVGARVLCTDVLDEQGSALAAEIRDAGGSAEFIAHDVTVEAQWERAVVAAVERFGGLDILVNNAGIEKMELLRECTVEDFRHIQEVNVVGVFLGIKHAVRAMSPGGAAGRGGSIINLSSIAGLIGYPGLAAYCASKGAVRLLTKSAAVECAQLGTGIRVNSIHPGLIQTDMGNALFDQATRIGLVPDPATAEEAMRAAHPVGHFGQPRDVAGAVLYLASDLSQWITGAELAVDGGFTAV